MIVFTKFLKAVSSAALAFVMVSPVAAQVTVVPGIPAGATIPRVVSTNPANMSRSVGTGLRQVTITFDQAMDVAAFFWNIPQTSTFPRLTDQPYWSNGNRTLVIPVALVGNAYYEIPLNVTEQNFRAATGVPLQPAKLQFWTTGANQGVMSTPAGGGGFTAPGSRRPAGGAGIGARNGNMVGGTSSGGTVGTSVAPATGGAGIGAAPTPIPPKKNSAFNPRRATSTPATTP